MSSNLKNSGVESSNILTNMGCFILLYAALLFILIVLGILMIFKCIRNKVKKLVIDYKNEMIWNGLIDTITLGYLKYCVSWWVSISNNIMNSEVASNAGDYM